MEKNKKLLNDYKNTVDELTKIKKVTSKEDELYKMYMVAKENKLSEFRNEKIMKRKEVSDNLQKNSFNPNKSKYLTNFENTSSESKKSNKNHKSERLHLKQINCNIVKGKDFLEVPDLTAIEEKMKSEMLLI